MKIDQYLDRSLFFAIHSCHEALTKELEMELKKENLNLLQSLILISVFFEESRCVVPSMLYQRLNTTRGNISHCVSSLEKRDYLKRILNHQDARSYLLALKPKGEAITLRLIKIFDQIETVMERRLEPNEVPQIQELIRKIRKNV